MDKDQISHIEAAFDNWDELYQNIQTLLNNPVVNINFGYDSVSQTFARGRAGYDRAMNLNQMYCERFRIPHREGAVGDLREIARQLRANMRAAVVLFEQISLVKVLLERELKMQTLKHNQLTRLPTHHARPPLPSFTPEELDEDIIDTTTESNNEEIDLGEDDNFVKKLGAEIEEQNKPVADASAVPQKKLSIIRR